MAISAESGKYLKDFPNSVLGFSLLFHLRFIG